MHTSDRIHFYDICGQYKTNMNKSGYFWVIYKDKNNPLKY